ncbi:MAG: glutathione S-transferase family protein [Pseudomonadota bacterium]
MYTLIGSYKSRAFRVLWALEEIGLAYDHIVAPPHSSEVKEVSPAGKVPVFLDGDAVITDSVAIMTYLADKHGALTAPAGTIERAQQDAWVNRINDEVDALLWTASRHSFILPEERRVPAVKDSLKWEFARNMDAIADELGDKEFLTGDQLTIADIILTHCGGWSIVANFPKTQKPKFADYFKRMIARPAYQAARKGV